MINRRCDPTGEKRVINRTTENTKNKPKHINQTWISLHIITMLITKESTCVAKYQDFWQYIL